MTSINRAAAGANAAVGSPPPDWQAAGLRYYAYNFYLRRKFGRRVQKVSVDAGFTCPNVDGTVAVGGCTFCDNRSFSPSRRVPRQAIVDQLDDGIRRLRRRYDCEQFLAYFQPATNTYAPVERLRRVYEEALAHPQVVGLAIGTRPDCVPGDVLDLIEELAASSRGSLSKKGDRHPPSTPSLDDSSQDREPVPLFRPAASGVYVSLEYGMQTMHDRTLDWMNRGHHHFALLDAVARSHGRGFELCAHVILGLPGESHDDMLATARELARLPIDAVKLHNLYAVKNTPLAEQVARGEVELLRRDDYVRVLVDFLELLPPSMVVERIGGDAPPDYFIGPAWCLDKPALRAAVLAEFERRDTRQGARYDAP